MREFIERNSNFNRSIRAKSYYFGSKKLEDTKNKDEVTISCDKYLIRAPLGYRCSQELIIINVIKLIEGMGNFNELNGCKRRAG